MKWRTHITGYLPNAQFAPPANPLVIAELEENLKITLPPDLKELYTETNGFIAPIATYPIWQAEKLLERNLEMRQGYEDLYMPFDCLLFFGDDGSGDLFGFRILSTGVETWQTFRWEHENDSRQWYSGGLHDYIFRRIAQICYPKE